MTIILEKLVWFERQCSQLLVIGRYLLSVARYNSLENIGRSLLKILKDWPLAIEIATLSVPRM
jgi:hypothetical protein